MAGEDEEPSEGGEGDTGNDMQPTGDDNDTQGGKRKRIARAQGANDEEPELGDDLFGSESDDEDFNPAQVRSNLYSNSKSKHRMVKMFRCHGHAHNAAYLRACVYAYWRVCVYVCVCSGGS